MVLDTAGPDPGVAPDASAAGSSWEGAAMSRIVVGIDGSEESKRALACAVHEARLRDAQLDLVYAVPEPIMLADPVLMPSPPRDTLRDEGLALIDKVLSDIDTGEIPTESIAAMGSPANVLCEVARGADLLVVGSRGLGGFRGLLLGSVTQQVVAHASCPILVVVPDNR
jgi:nucleotide-binding universal stress UspA family protein